MTAYLDAHPPVRPQWYDQRNRPLTGCTVLHTAESVMDTVGPDTGAEVVAAFIQARTTPGSYHDLCDSDSALELVDLSHAAFHDGTGSNNWALSISFACRTSDWRVMSPARRAAFLARGAEAFARQQAYRRRVGAPLTELRRITKAQSDAGASGFIAHGDRDPGRRTDPGIAAPDLFPWDEWLAACRVAIAGQMPAPQVVPVPDDRGDPMQLIRNAKGAVTLLSSSWAEWVATAADHKALTAALGPHVQLSDELYNRLITRARAAGAPMQAAPVSAAARMTAVLEDPDEVDPDEVDPDDPSTWPATPGVDA